MSVGLGHPQTPACKEVDYMYVDTPHTGLIVIVQPVLAPDICWFPFITLTPLVNDRQ